MKTFVVPVSGGKDSQLCLVRAIETVPRENIRAVHQFTGYDHPLTYQHLEYMQLRYGVPIEFVKSEEYSDIYDLIEKIEFFPSGWARRCTGKLKQEPFAAWLRKNFELVKPDQVHIMMGMRSDESSGRNNRYGSLDWDSVLSLPQIAAIYGNDFRHVEVTLPIVDLSAQEVFDLLAARGDEINPLYRMGHERIGCFPCLLASPRVWALAVHDPEGRKNVQKLVQIETKFKENGKPYKIHPTIDVHELLDGGPLLSLLKEDDTACGWCSI